MNTIYKASENHQLKVERACWEDPVLVVSGRHWSFSTTSSWRLLLDISMLSGSEEKNAQEAISRLKSAVIAEIVSSASKPSVDPEIKFSTGMTLQVFSATLYDAWVLRLPDLPVLVGPTSLG